MSDTTFSLQVGKVRQLHHVGIYYFVIRRTQKQEPKIFETIRRFWQKLGMRCHTLFAQTSPDRGARGWRLYVGSVRDPVQIAYRPLNLFAISALCSRITPSVHVCFRVELDALKRLRQHPAFEREITWGKNHGQHSIIVTGPLGEEVEFTCSLSEPLDADD